MQSGLKRIREQVNNKINIWHQKSFYYLTLLILKTAYTIIKCQEKYDSFTENSGWHYLNKVI